MANCREGPVSCYVDWQTYEMIRRVIRDNRAEYMRTKTRGAPRDGDLLLHGIAWCARCGHKMYVRYKGGGQYVCNHLRSNEGLPACQYIRAARVDAVVADAFLTALAPAELDALSRARRAQQQVDTALRSSAERQLERKRYAAALAERQFNRVDPDNRLVAAELERRWEVALSEARAAEEALVQQSSPQAIGQMGIGKALHGKVVSLAGRLPQIWEDPATIDAQRKALLRCLVDKVVLDRGEHDVALVRIVWRGGAVSKLEGSIANVDEAGGIQVGPRSAGAVPGPVCYDRSGSQPTVTDANLVLGYLSPDALVGGDLPLNRAKAEAAIGTLGARLGLSLTDTAYGIHLIANSNMMRALNGVSSERGRDPSNYKLLVIGGNGAVHAATLAEDLRIATIVVPPIAGVFSALGMLFADIEHQLIRAHYRLLGALDLAETTQLLRSMVAEGAVLLAEEGYPPEWQEFRIIAETKYVGQMSTLPLEVPALPVTEEVVARMGEAFAGAHEYASPHEKVQIVAVKVLERGISPAPRVPAAIVPDRETRRSEGARGSPILGPNTAAS
jgi:hypothetical protein